MKVQLPFEKEILDIFHNESAVSRLFLLLLLLFNFQFPRVSPQATEQEYTSMASMEKWAAKSSTDVRKSESSRHWFKSTLFYTNRYVFIHLRQLNDAYPYSFVLQRNTFLT